VGESRRRPLVCLLIALVSTGALAASDLPHVRVPGTRVSLSLPEGFSLSTEFPGIGADDLTSVLVTELAAPLATTAEGFSPEALAGRGVVVHRASDVAVGARRGRLLHATQRVDGVTFRKWILLLGDHAASVLVTATTPLDLETVHQEALVGVLQGARWDPALSVPAGEGLRFRVSEVATLRVMSTAPNAVVLSDPDHDPQDGAIPPLLVAGSSVGQVHVGNLQRFAEERLHQTATIDEIEVESRAETMLGPLTAQQIVASARDIETERAVRVTQILASDGARYYLVQGIVDASRAEAFAAPFAAVVASFELVEQP